MKRLIIKIVLLILELKNKKCPSTNKYDVEMAEVVMRELNKIVCQLMATIRFIVVIVVVAIATAVAIAIVVLWLSIPAF